MKYSNVSIRRAVVSAKTAAAAAFALTVALAVAGMSQAQDASRDGSSWDMLDSVLVVPPVYRSDAKSAPPTQKNLARIFRDRFNCEGGLESTYSQQRSSIAFVEPAPRVVLRDIGGGTLHKTCGSAFRRVAPPDRSADRFRTLYETAPHE